MHEILVHLSPSALAPLKIVTQHDFNQLYHFVYGFIFIMLHVHVGIMESLFICLSIGTLFALIATLKRAQGE